MGHYFLDILYLGNGAVNELYCMTIFMKGVYLWNVQDVLDIQYR